MSPDAVVAAIVRAATANGIGIRFYREPDRLPDAVVAEAISALAAEGFAVLRAATDLVSDYQAPIAGRHVALICAAGVDRVKAASCVRWLGRTSPRGHFVLLLGWPRRGPWRDDLSIARERAWPLGRAEPGPPWLRRAEISQSRHRFASAERWFRAAMAAAYGRGDEADAGTCCERLVDLLVEQGQPRRAWPLAIDLAGKVGAYGPRSRLLTAAAAALMAGGEFDRAEALLAALDAEAEILDEELPPPAEACRMELTCWRGRFDRAPPVAGLRSPSAIGWCGLAAWARGDHRTLPLLEEQVRVRSRGESGDEATFWSAALATLATSPGPGVDAHADRLVTVAERSSARRRSLAGAIAAEVVLAAGKPERALEWLDRAEAPSWAAHSLLHEWLRARCHRNSDAIRTLRSRIRRAGVDGILRWGEGKDGMHLIHGLPALLHLVQDADDDQAALKGGCAWLRRQTGADEAAILTADGGRVIAGDGWSGVKSGEPSATAPIRSSRAVIGQVVARGLETDRLVIEQGVHAVAALLAPAVRSRLDGLALSRDADRAVAEILGASPAMAAVREAVARAALTGFPVLIEGESGTGKELVARAVHRLSARRDRPFAAVNCAALTDDLIEAELFGHARGAFTGALGTRAGLFEWAHGGTLFLDEVGELSPRGQAKVLRALQEREIRRVGENSPRAVDVRVVAATNVVLAEAVTRGVFRQDLLYRLAVVRIRLPPLRERIEDIPRLAHAFWKPVAAERGGRTRLGADALAALCRHRWPGNVRELQNAIAGLVVSAPARGRVTERHVRQVLAMAAPDEAAVSLDAARRLAERRAVTSALARHGGCRSAAASELGISRQGLAKALRRLGLSGLAESAGGSAPAQPPTRSLAGTP
jgi:two-component system response regulator HydG